MGRRNRIQIEWHDNGALVWTWPLTRAVSGGALAVLAVGGVLWATGVTGTAGSKIFTGMAIPTGVALFVAVSGWLISANRLRYQDVEFPAVPQPSSAPARGVAPRRRSTGRRSGWAYAWMVLFGGGLTIDGLHPLTSQGGLLSAVLLILAACCVSGCYLAGPAARFVVTPEYLHIDTALRRMTVPRELIAEFARGPQALRIRSRGGDHLDVRVDSPLWEIGGNPYRTNLRAQLRTAERIAAMMREVPAAAPAGGRVIITPRWGMRTLAIATAAMAVAAVVAFPFAVKGSP